VPLALISAPAFQIRGHGRAYIGYSFTGRPHVCDVCLRALRAQVAVFEAAKAVEAVVTAAAAAWGGFFALLRAAGPGFCQGSVRPVGSAGGSALCRMGGWWAVVGHVGAPGAGGGESCERYAPETAAG
jgi:hypothetical protein